MISTNRSIKKRVSRQVFTVPRKLGQGETLSSFAGFAPAAGQLRQSEFLDPKQENAVCWMWLTHH